MGNTHLQKCQLNYFIMNVVLTWVFSFNNTTFLQHTVQTKEVFKVHIQYLANTSSETHRDKPFNGNH